MTARFPARAIVLAALLAASWTRPAEAQVEPTVGANDAQPVAPSAPPSPSPPAPDKDTTSTVVGLRLDGGGTLRKVLELPISGADLGLAIGAQPSPDFAVWGAARLMLGSTENGLAVYTWRLGPDFDFILDRVRFGVGPNLFGIGIHRAARSDTITTWGPALHGGVRVDAFRPSGFAIFVRLDGDAGFPVATQTMYYGATLGVGVDIDLHGKRPGASPKE